MDHLVQMLLGILMLFVTLQESEQLPSWGSNVCSQYVYQSTWTSYTTSRTHYKEYTTSCGIWGWGRCKGKRAYRTYYTAGRYTSVGKTLYKCCSGWRRSGNHCPTPICHWGCNNGGTCSSPNKCSCRSGFLGSRCQYDRNECSSYNGGCQQVCTNTHGSYTCGCRRGYDPSSPTRCKDIDECARSSKLCQCGPNIINCGAKCINTIGSYKCSCGSGYKILSSNKRICIDDDECSAGTDSCAQRCVNNVGSYTCICHRGFLSKRNGTVCDDLDECKTSNGGCQHNCTNSRGSMQCSCKEGFSLNSDNRTCSDIDECAQDDDCEHNCTNTIGSFRCSCKPGFKLNNNGKICSDIDECSESYSSEGNASNILLANCEQTCVNTRGSYQCACRPGFELREDGMTCKDIDECTSGLHQCSHICKNTYGSYQCSCVTGYGLEADGKACKVLPCRTLIQQPHGIMNCTGMATNDNCSFACNYGYNMQGFSTITCMSSSRWSENPASCKAKRCSKMAPPTGGSLTLPCYNTYGSSCQMKCSTGYYPIGQSTITCDLTKENKTVEWKNNFQCHHALTCQPNPCRHGGTCIPLVSKDFQCDCSNTGYKGKLCEQGVIDIPVFPKLKANLQSSSLALQAKPAIEIQVSIQADDSVVVQPNVIKLTKSIAQAKFTLTSKQPGFKVITYSVEGESAKDYTNPANNVLFVGQETPQRKSIFAKVPILPGELPIGCNVKQINLTKCRVKSMSSQPWRGHRLASKPSTTGIVHILTKRGLRMPLTLLGVDFPYSMASLVEKAKHIDQTPQTEHNFINHKNTCYNTTIEKMQFLQLVEHDWFAASFFDAFSRNGPRWLRFKAKERSTYFDLKNIHAVVGSEPSVCSTVQKSPSVFYFSPNIGSKVIIDNEEISLPDEEGSCYAMDVCTSRISWVLSKGSTRMIQELSILKKLKQAGWDIELKEVIFSGDERLTPKGSSFLWNEEDVKQTEYDMLLRGKIRAQLNNREDDVKISLQYYGDVYTRTDNVSEALHFGFDTKLTNIFEGKAALTIKTVAANIPLNIQFPFSDVVGKSVIGGKTKTQFLFFRWNTLENVFHKTPLASLIQHYKSKPVDLMVDVEAQGGKKEQLTNITEIQSSINLISSLLPQLKIIIDNVEIKHRVSSETTKRYKTIVSEVASLVDNIQKLSKNYRPPATERQRKKLTCFISDLRTKVENVRYFCHVLMSTLDDGVSKLNTASIIAEIKYMDTKLLRVPYVQTRRSAVKQTFRNFEIKFEGNMCAGRLCFKDIKISLKKDQDGLTIRGLATKYLKLGKVLSLAKGQEVILKIKGKDESNQIFFRPTVDIFGIKKIVSAEIKESTLNFNTTGLLLERHQATINVKANTDVAEWNLLKFKVTGLLDKNTSLMKELQTKINSRILELADKANERIQKAKTVAGKARQKVFVLKQLVKEKKKIVNQLQKQKRRLFIAWRLANSKYWNFTSSNGKSTNANVPKENQKNRGVSRRSVNDNYPCNIRDPCPKIRTSGVDQCGFVQKKLEISSTVEKCKGFIKKDYMVYKVMSTTKKSYYFVPRYVNVVVSSCRKPKPLFTVLGALVGTGTGVVAATLGLVISSNPVALAAIGIGLIGGIIIGGIVDLIMGCKLISRSVRGPDEKITFMKIYYERKSVPRHYFIPDCDYFQIKLPSESFGEPKLVCRRTYIKVPDPACVISNQQCIRQLNSLPTIDPALKRLFHKHKLVNQVEGAKMKLDLTTSKLHRRDLELATAISSLKHSRLARERSTSAISELMKFEKIKTGLRLHKKLGEWKTSEMASISQIKFNSAYMSSSGGLGIFRFPTTITLSSAMAKISKNFSFLADYFNMLPFLRAFFFFLYYFFVGIVSIVSTLLSRIGRSIIVQPPILGIDTNPTEFQTLQIERRTLPVNNGTFGHTDNLQTNEDVCLLAKNGNQFFQDVVMHLQRRITDHEISQLNDDNEESEGNKAIYRAIMKLRETPKNRSKTGINETEGMLNTYLDLITSLSNVTKRNAALLSWDDILSNWRSFLEVLAKENSFPYCAGALDCVDETGDKLQELYFYEEDMSRAREIRRLLSNITDGITYLMTQNITMNAAKEKISEILQLLNRTNDETVLCGTKPEFTLTPNQNHVVLVGGSFILKCNASSDTPLRYTWIHNGESILESVTTGVLKITNATTSDEGAYKCKATNRKGYVTSNITLINIHSKPRITKHPNNTKAYTKDATVAFLLTCNASGDPEPDIEWFFISRYPNSSAVKIYNDNDTFLYYEQPSTNDSGYYFCVASNIHGRADSAKAKVWVLDMSPGEPILAAKINVSKTCKKTKRRRANCGKFKFEKSDDEDDQDLRIIKDALGESMNSSESHISKTFYQSDKQRNATVVFLYRGSKPEEEKKGNDTDIDPVVQEYARKRQQLLVGLRKLFHDVKDGLFNASSEKEVIEADPNTLSVLDVDTGCSTGQVPHTNGYMCENCPPGTHGTKDGRCIPCPLKTYQYEQGQVECLPCDYGFITTIEGALSHDDCFDMRASPPRNLRAIAISSTRLKVLWQAPARNQKSMWYYFIKYGQIGSKSRYKRVSKTVTTWTLTRLKKFTDYHITVYAVNYYGRTMSKIIAKTGEDVPDAAPRIVQYIPVSYDHMKIAWNAIPEHKSNGIIRGYIIYYRALDEYKWNAYNTTTGNLTSTIVPGLQSYTDYCVKISAFTGKGEYPAWKRESCRKLKTPSRPVEVTGRALSPREILLKFRKPGRSSAFNTFVVHYGTNQNRLRIATACYSSSCVISNLQEDTMYFFKVIEDVVQTGESTAVLHIRTKRRGRS